jgi:hypothetical protein
MKLARLTYNHPGLMLPPINRKEIGVKGASGTWLESELMPGFFLRLSGQILLVWEVRKQFQRGE